ncbi:DUF3419 family protein [Streptomyces sp. NPDC001594]|uniref:DUF3419 family protein n=1 Tax=Streptomyces sp. NPDC001594 TaxID=3364590 RepID=UPI0036AEBE65
MAEYPASPASPSPASASPASCAPASPAPAPPTAPPPPPAAPERRRTAARSARPAKSPVAGRLFSLLHGRSLVYNVCWEDPALDRAALRLDPDDHVLVITSAGCNALDYLLAGAGRVSAVDVNPRQTALLELKRAAARRLEHPEFFALFGHGRTPRARALYRDALRRDLSPFARRYWDRHIDAFTGRGPRGSFHHHGTAGLLAAVIMFVLRRGEGVGRAFEDLFHTTTPAHQAQVYESRLREPLRTAARLASRPLALALAGVPPEQRREISTEYPGGAERLVQDAFDAVFGRLPVQDNYFWRGYVLGSYTPDCCPEYLKRENFVPLRDALDRLDVHTATVTGFLTGAPRPSVSKFVLLDHMDWMGWADQGALAREWQAIVDAARPGARVIHRSAGLTTRFLDPVRVAHGGRLRPLNDLLRRDEDLAARLHARDRVHTYGSFHIADLP